MSPALPSRTLRPSRLGTAGLALALALGLTGCGSGLRAQTYQERTTSDSTNEAIGALAVRHIRVLPPQGGESYPVGSDARVAFVLVNEGKEADRLTSVTSDSASSVAVTGLDGRPASLTVPGQSGPVSEYTFVLRGLTRELRTGQYVQMELVFAVNGAETMLVPVELTGTPGPRREGYHVVETDSEGNPLPEREGSSHGEEEGAHGGEEGDAHGGEEQEGSGQRAELDNDGGDSGSGDQQVDAGHEPVGDVNGGASGATPPPEG